VGSPKKEDVKQEENKVKMEEASTPKKETKEEEKEEDKKEEYTRPPPGSGKWRCLACTSAEPIVWSAYNDEDQLECKECHKPIEECGRCLWLPYAQLPRSKQIEVDKMYSPPIVSVIRTKWKNAIVDFHGVNPPSM